MLIAEPRSLLKTLNPTSTRALERAASACISARHYEVTVEHLLLALLDDLESDIYRILERFEIDPARLRSTLQRYVGELRSGNAGKPVFGSLLLELVQDGWVYASTELGDPKLRSGALVTRIAAAPSRYLPFELPDLEKISREDLRKNLPTIAAASSEAASIRADAAATSGDGAARPAGTSLGAAEGPLARFTLDLTERAKSGGLDPVFGREQEIRNVVDVLVRRRKNNPIIVGEPGVGKTALVEGLALAIAEGNVPDQLKNVHVLSLDLGALQAGAGVKGEFENRLKGVISEVKASPKPIVLFIDEAHTLIGAGGPQGGGDAANLLKPALARGELRTIAATTWAEYKKYFEKDAALERRFQPIKVEEPSIEIATLMIRGLARKFEEAHGVVIQDEAVKAAVTLSSRYISGRLLPDKAVDLLDTAAARAKIVRAARPGVIDDKRAALAGVERELDAFDRDFKAGLAIDDEAKTAATAHKEQLRADLEKLEAQTAHQRSIVERIDTLRKESAAPGGVDATASQKDEKRTALRAALDELKAIKVEDRLVTADVDETLVATIVCDWTGIPAGKMAQDDVQNVLKLEERLRTRVRGQDQALAVLGRELRSARSGLKPPQQPLGVFLLVGPSGVGKTETALGIADQIFGGERFTVTINMSEFLEKHTISRLVGSPPGYVGFGEGGLLTEAVRQRPYSVVLLDEVEKAHPEVLNLFYQVFDKGTLADGEGRDIDFRNTVVILTSNLATDLITSAAMPGQPQPKLEDVISLVKPTLSAHFKPALLARMTVVPYYPIGTDALLEIVGMKVGAIIRRAKEAHGLELVVKTEVKEAIAARCREVESGARNIDHILRGTVLPLVSSEILRRMAVGEPLERLELGLAADGEIVCLPGGAA